MKAAKGFVLVAALALGLVACAKPEARVGGKAAPSGKLVTVRMNLSPSMSSAPAVIAKEEGYFRDEGIDLEFARIDMNAAMLALAAGSLDAVVNPIRSGLFNTIIRGVSFQIVADDGYSDPGGCAPQAFTAPPEIVARVKKSGLRGEKIAIIKGGITEFLTDRLLARYGLTPADVQFVEYPPGEVMMGQHRVFDSIRYNFEPSLSLQVDKGLVGIVATANEVAPGHQEGILGFGGRLLDEDHELGVRFMRAWLRGVRRYNEGKTDRNVAIISGYTHFPPEVIRTMCWMPIAADGRVKPEAVQPLLDWARAKQYLEAEVPTSAWWNPSFIDEANRELAVAGSH